MSSKDVTRWMKNKYPVHIMVWEGSLVMVMLCLYAMYIFIYPQGLKLNTNPTTRTLTSECSPGSDLDPISDNRTLQTFHISRRTRLWLLVNFCDHISPDIWSPKSSDCSTIDYYVWMTVERENNKTRCMMNWRQWLWKHTEGDFPGDMQEIRKSSRGQGCSQLGF